MKYFIHDNDLCDSPTMQSVIVELGLAGYGRAIIMLETLAKYVKNDGKFLFQLPLDRPMDISYWARKFQQTVEETERTFDAFERSALIGQWRETQTIFAPMLGERLDEYTKRLKPKTPKRRGSK